MPKKKPEQKRYFIKDKEVITDSSAPVISNEFIDTVDGDEYRGQTIEVQSDTKLEADQGEGDPYILRTFNFALDPVLMKERKPNPQELFNAFSRGIEAMLWGDGLTVVSELEPRLIFTKKKTHVLIMVWAKPRMGQSILENPKTLTEIISDSRTNPHKI